MRDQQTPFTVNSKPLRVSKYVYSTLRTGFGTKETNNPPAIPNSDAQCEQQLLVLLLGKQPASYGRWSLRLLADQLVTLEVLDSISPGMARFKK